jgi:protocatechuate 3,4-dioxygenase beta subunit
MKNLILIALIVFSVHTAMAKGKTEPAKAEPATQSVICGKVLDKATGEELPGALVKIKGSDKTCFTDFEGNYQFKGLEKGNYELEVELISYEKVGHLTMVVGKNEVHELTIKIETLN